MPAIRHVLPNRLTWAVAIGFVLPPSAAIPQEPVAWKTGLAFRRQLDEPVTRDWQGRALRDGLSRVSETDGVAIFLDRRIDPDQHVTLTMRDVPLESFLKQAAAAARAETAIIGSVIYVGPIQTASPLATIAAIRRQEVSRLPNDAKARLLRTDPWQCEELAQPRQLVSDLARHAGVTAQGLDNIPLDLWPAIRLPPLTWVDRMTLLLAGFGLTFEIDAVGAAIRLVPAPQSAVVEKRYIPVGNPANFASQLQRVLPQAKTRVEQAQLVVTARQEDHEKIERLISGQSVRTTKASKVGVEKEYSLQVENKSAGSVIQKVATELGKELKFDPQVQEKLKQPVELQLNRVTLDHLMEATLKSLGLTYRLTDDTLEIIERK